MEAASTTRLDRLIEAAGLGALAVMRVYRSDFEVRTKSDETPVTRADVEAEAVIAEALRASFPNVPLVAEEAVSRGHLPSVGRRYLLVDPLDGTKEFVHRTEEFTVNAALIEDGKPVAGAVLAPALGRGFAGDIEAGAFELELDADGRPTGGRRALKLNGRPEKLVAFVSRFHRSPETLDLLALFDEPETRAVGSSLKFGLLAAGEAQIYPRLGRTMAWDTAAGDAVLRAAGGCTVTLDGTPLRYAADGADGTAFANPPFVALGNPDLAARLRQRPA